MMRFRLSSFIRLERAVARSISRCGFCSWESIEFDAVHLPTIGGVALGIFCSERCASRWARERGCGSVERMT
jgi:hypothetical protein